MSTRMNPGRQLILGIFIVSALGLLGYYTLFLKEFSLFSEQAQISVTFDEARGLRAGDAVRWVGQLAGGLPRTDCTGASLTSSSGYTYGGLLGPDLDAAAHGLALAARALRLRRRAAAVDLKVDVRGRRAVDREDGDRVLHVAHVDRLLARGGGDDLGVVAVEDRVHEVDGVELEGARGRARLGRLHGPVCVRRRASFCFLTFGLFDLCDGMNHGAFLRRRRLHQRCRQEPDQGRPFQRGFSSH